IIAIKILWPVAGFPVCQEYVAWVIPQLYQHQLPAANRLLMFPNRYVLLPMRYDEHNLTALLLARRIHQQGNSIQKNRPRSESGARDVEVKLRPDKLLESSCAVIGMILQNRPGTI